MYVSVFIQYLIDVSFADVGQNKPAVRHQLAWQHACMSKGPNSMLCHKGLRFPSLCRLFDKGKESLSNNEPAQRTKPKFVKDKENRRT